MAYSSFLAILLAFMPGCDGDDHPMFSLTVTKGGTVTSTPPGVGTGTVTSTPSGISCGSTCSASFDQDASVTLTATPAAGSTFAGWSEGCSGTGTCTVRMTQASNVTATFRVQQFTLQAVSRGALVPASPLGFAEFREDGTPFYHRDGGTGGGRGFNIAAIDPGTGALLQAVRNFDTWGTRNTGTDMSAMIAFLKGLPNGTVVLVAVGDEAGLNNDNTLPNPCAHLSFLWVEAGLRAIEELGSTQLRNYCYRYSWAMVSVKGESGARDEKLGNAIEVSVQTTLILP